MKKETKLIFNAKKIIYPVLYTIILLIVATIGLGMSKMKSIDLDWSNYYQVLKSGDINRLEKICNSYTQITGRIDSFIDTDKVSIKNDKYPELIVLSYLDKDEIQNLSLGQTITIKGTIGIHIIEGRVSLCITDYLYLWKPKLIK